MLPNCTSHQFYIVSYTNFTISKTNCHIQQISLVQIFDDREIERGWLAHTTFDKALELPWPILKGKILIRQLAYILVGVCSSQSSPNETINIKTNNIPNLILHGTALISDVWQMRDALTNHDLENITTKLNTQSNSSRPSPNSNFS